MASNCRSVRPPGGSRATSAFGPPFTYHDRLCRSALSAQRAENFLPGFHSAHGIVNSKPSKGLVIPKMWSRMPPRPANLPAFLVEIVWDRCQRPPATHSRASTNIRTCNSMNEKSSSPRGSSLDLARCSWSPLIPSGVMQIALQHHIVLRRDGNDDSGKFRAL